MLWRALKHVQNGFYIDVGAAWPDNDSVTKAFYDRGWRGINIEPNPIHFSSLKKQRERDINLQLAVGEQAGELTMNFIGSTGLSTLDETIADQHKVNGWGVESVTVSVQPLCSVVSLNVPAGQDIHFLKVDVEGFEKQALQSHDWVNFRPWIVMVEATLPMSQKESFSDWEPILLGADYLFAYADGLNRFYVAKEHSDLMDAFKYPPNVFDGFVLTEKVQTEAKVQQAEAKAQQAQAASDVHLAQLHAVYASTSWRITAPLRWAVQQLRLLRAHGFKQRGKAAAKKVLRILITWVAARPSLSRMATQVAHQLGLAERLKPFVIGLLSRQQHDPEASLPLTPRAKQFYRQLKQAGEKKTSESSK